MALLKWDSSPNDLYYIICVNLTLLKVLELLCLTMRHPKLRSSRKLDPSIRRTLEALSNRKGGKFEEEPPIGSSTSIVAPRHARSRSRREPSSGKKTSSLIPTHHGLSSKRSIQKRSRSRSRSRRRNPLSSRGRQLIMTPSRIWLSLPIKFRIIILIAGFVFIYYILFAKHHHFDRESTSIRHDVENLVRQANKSGFMHQLFIEAKLPEIFAEDENPTPPQTPSQHPKKITKIELSSKNKNGNAQSKKNKSGGVKNGGKTPRKKKEGKEKDKDMKAEDVNSGSTITKDNGAIEARNASSIKTKESADLQQSTSESLNSTGSTSLDSIALKDVTIQNVSVAENATFESITEEGPGPDSVLPDGNITIELAPASATKTKNGSVGATHADKKASTDPQSMNHEKKPKNKTEEFSSNASTSAPKPEGGGNQISSEGEGNLSVDSGNMITFDEGEYANQFQDLRPEEIPKDHLPVLTWNYNAITNAEVSEQIFGLGNKLDHVAIYKPLCIDVAKEDALAFEGNSVCSGFNRTVGWFIQYCSVMRGTIRKEYLLQVQEERKSKAWLNENADQIQWVEGLTVLQILEKNCGNIAHFAGRILLLQHILDNIMAYSAPPRNPANVLIVPTFHIMKRFLYPHNYEFWHKNFFQALIAPHKYTIGTLGNFLYRDSKPRPDKAPIVQLLHNFSTDGSEYAGKKFVCFRRAIVPSYLKARFFVNDFEYPSAKPSLQSIATDAPPVPRDSLRLRERVSALIDQDAEYSGREKQIMLLDRTGSRRVFGPEAREKMLGMIKNVADEKGYTFTVTGFDKMTFAKQYEVMKKVSIAVGIHGANLVNTMFMPPLSVLFEIFPFGFRHEMYANGGNAGLKYLSYMMKEGTPFDGPKVYRTVEQCIRLNPKCKVHYRDATLQVTDEDMAQMEKILRESIDWCNALPNPEVSGKNDRRRRRRRRF